MCQNIFSKINFRKHYQSIIFYVGNLFSIALLTNTIRVENKNKCYTKLFFILRGHKKLYSNYKILCVINIFYSFILKHT